ncbi:MAG: hypothetical protein R3263_11455 [Myxococcota bacterium]|nr:hypothetical protein [Myxococcota bacterium]
MSILLDHLSSVLVTAALALMLVATQVQGQRSAVERTALYAAKKHTLEVADLLTRDLENLGLGMPYGQRIGSVRTDSSGRTRSFEFWRQDAGGSPVRIRYALEEAGTVMAGGERVPLFAVQRYQDGVASGGSLGAVRFFRIEVLDEAGAPVAPTSAAARQVRIQLASVLALAGEDGPSGLRQTSWGTTLRPYGLN